MTLDPADPLVPLLLSDCRRWIEAGRRPLIGLNGPVGAGKSRLAAELRQAFAAAGLQLAVASIDDAYLPWPERRRRLEGNPFGVSRVPPGSHDPSALLLPLRRWRNRPWRASGLAMAALQLPRFDKTLRDGAGDRVEPWRGDADAVLLEGWLIGCRSLPEAELRAWHGMSVLEPAERDWLQRCNGWLQDYQELWAELDALLMLWPSSWQLPRRWRFQAEARQRRAGGGWMTGEALDRLVAATLRSLPADLYQRPLLRDARWVRVLDGRRRCRWQGPGDALLGRDDQSSSPCSSATG
jgi:D-glycerate 3-kinase